MIDIIIIGAGVSGSSIARELSKYNLDVLILEKNNEVANESSKANTAIVHSGYDPEPGTLMSKLNVQGNAMYDELYEQLGFPFQRNGSLIVAVDDEEIEKITMLYKRGLENKVPGIKLIDRDEILKIEPNISDQIIKALYCPTGGIVSPWQLTENLCEVAADNGVKLHLSEKVLSIKKEDEVFYVTTNKGEYKTKVLINAAGVHSDDVHNMICEKEFEITPVRGEYLVYPHHEGSKVNTTIFQVPTKKGKGVLVTPTAHGHLIVGPTSDPITDKNERITTPDTFDSLLEKSEKSIKNIDFKQPIRQYAGIRANSTANEFIIKENEKVKGFIDVAGIKSPGLSSAPAIALMVVDIIKNTGRLEFTPNETFNPYRRVQKVLYTYENDKRDEVVKDDSNFGEYVDRHESITTGDILDIVRRNAGATTLNGIKRRTRCGASESQMIFVMPKLIEILSKELKKDPTEIVLEDEGSYILTKKAKLESKDVHLSYDKLDFNELKDEYDTVIIGASIDGLKKAKSSRLDGNVLVVDLLEEVGGSIYEMLKFETSINENVDLTKINGLLVEDVNYLLETAAFEVDSKAKLVDLVSKKGYKRVKYTNLIIATGEYEANRENLYIPGSRPSGIFSPMQSIRLFNKLNYLFGENVLIYGDTEESRLVKERLLKEGVNVTMLEGTDKITRIIGYPRISGVEINSEKIVECDTLIISKKYIPDNVLTKHIGLDLDENDYVLVDSQGKTSVDGVYAVGTIAREK